MSRGKAGDFSPINNVSGHQGFKKGTKHKVVTYTFNRAAGDPSRSIFFKQNLEEIGFSSDVKIWSKLAIGEMVGHV